jgi:hypothetical protein
MVGVDLQSGEVKHNVELFAVAKPPALHARNTPASPTPAVVGNHVVASFGSDGVGCVDAGTGKVVWRNNALKVNYETGPGSSPVPYKDLVILPCDGRGRNEPLTREEEMCRFRISANSEPPKLPPSDDPIVLKQMIQESPEHGPTS